MKHLSRYLIALLFSTVCLTSYPQKTSNVFDINNLQVKWELIENMHQGESQFFSKLTFHNSSKTLFPSTGWSIYFSNIRNIDSASISEGFHIKHINGDIYRLAPNRLFKGVKADETVELSYVTEGNFINFSDAPLAPYIVWDNTPSKGETIASYKILPPKEDKVGYITPEIIYQQNSLIPSIPSDRITKIFPTPVDYKENGGFFSLSSDVKIANQEGFQQEANYLIDQLEFIFKSKVHTGSQPNTIILKKIDSAPEGYQLIVKPNTIEIGASTAKGIFYGIQSLKMLLPHNVWAGTKTPISIPCIEVNDEPRFGFRSIMLDVARNFQPSSEIKKIIDLMSLYKLNVLHFHFIDDEGWRIEIPSLPELTQVGARRGHTLDSKSFLPASFSSGPDVDKSSGSGYYTREDFIGILKYATERHIEVIPEIESPGHARAAIKSMDARYERFMAIGNKQAAEEYLLRDINDKSSYLSAQLWTDNVMNVALPSTYRFMEKVIDEIQSMYREANAPLSTIHLGGDEVPAGVWEKSPICNALINSDPTLHNTDDLWYHYYGKLKDVLDKRNLFLSGWEEIALRKTSLDGNKVMIPNPDFTKANFQVNVWNNMIGWGNEDLPYRLANAGYKVILSCVSNNYFDLATQKSFYEPGYYWGGFVGIEKPFYFIPFNYYKNSTEDRFGNPVDPSYFIGKDRLTDYGKTNIIGVQGLLWSENLFTPEKLEYMLIPKIFGLVERAWAKDPEWATEKNKSTSLQLYQNAFTSFVNVLAKNELPRLDHYAGGFSYRIPTAGVRVKDGLVYVNAQFPSWSIHYTTDGTEPTTDSPIYTQPISKKGIIKVGVFNSIGRCGRTIEVANN
ncbi:MAG: beta-N-acetylhexosaminidase [Bacteroidales bacterium]|nr:MAG: beta-N-acetylhexosaminidase [Bacteroidales bacterium]